MVVILVLVCTSFGQETNYSQMAVSSCQPKWCATIFVGLVLVVVFHYEVNHMNVDIAIFTC